MGDSISLFIPFPLSICGHTVVIYKYLDKWQSHSIGRIGGGGQRVRLGLSASIFSIHSKVNHILECGVIARLAVLADKFESAFAELHGALSGVIDTA